MTDEAKNALETLIRLGYPRGESKKAVRLAVAKMPDEQKNDFEKVFRAAIKALR